MGSVTLSAPSMEYLRSDNLSMAPESEVALFSSSLFVEFNSGLWTALDEVRVELELDDLSDVLVTYLLRNGFFSHRLHNDTHS